MVSKRSGPLEARASCVVVVTKVWRHNIALSGPVASMCVYWVNTLNTHLQVCYRNELLPYATTYKNAAQCHVLCLVNEFNVFIIIFMRYLFLDLSEVTFTINFLNSATTVQQLHIHICAKVKHSQ